MSQPNTPLLLQGVANILRPHSKVTQVVWGDEVESVLASATDLWDLYIGVRRQLGPQAFYMGVGFGEVTSGTISGEIHELNGTAFKSAREAVDAAKAAGGREIALRFSVHGEGELTRALNAFIDVLNASFGRMTRQQKVYMRDLVLGLSQTEIARRHRRAQASVQGALARAGHDQLAYAREGLVALLALTARETTRGEAHP